MGRKREIRTVGRMGNTPGVSVPQAYLDKLNLKRGDKIEVSYDEESKEIRLRPVYRIPEGLSPEFMKALDETHKQFEEALRNLRDR